MRMRKFMTVFVAMLALALIAGLFFVSIWGENKKRQTQLTDFKADVVASGFTLLPGKNNPSIDDDTSGTGKKAKTKTTLEALVVVKGCTVELARDYDEPRNAGKRHGRTIEIYELDEALRGRDEIEINGAPSSPTPDGVEKYLASKGDKFKYCLTA